MAIHSLIPWRRESREISPTADRFNYLRQQIDRLFEEPFGSLRGLAGEGMFEPDVDMTERDKDILVTAELPGIDQKDVQIEVDEDMLTIRGEKRSEESGEQGGRRWKERSYGKFERSIQLPTDVKADAAKAEFKNGVLRITLPKSEMAKPHAHKISIS